MKPISILTATVALASMLGCGANITSIPHVVPASGVSMRGGVHGGQQLLTGSRIYLFAAGKTGYGSASTSLLNTSSPGVATDLSGNGYVTSDLGGNFTITGDWTCPNASDQIYMIAIGGNPGLAAGTNNTAIAMMNALGTCSALNSGTFIIINELSTVAAANALAQFYVDPTHIGATAANSAGIANAFATASNLVDMASEPSARTVTRAGNGTVPTATINTLANILSACINSSSASSTPCAFLFLVATPSGGAATETLTIAVDIALNPARHVTAIYGLAPASPPFQPSLTTAPADFTLGISYTLGASVALPGYIAIDGPGNVWISSRPSQNGGGTDAIIKLSPTGQVLSGTGFTDGGFVNLPEGIAIDDTGAVWVANTSSTILKLNNDGTNATGFPYFGASYPQDIAIDKSGRAWVTNFGSSGSGNTLTVISGSGSLVTTLSPPTLSGAQGIAIDAFNNAWVASQSTNTLTEIASNFTYPSGPAGFTGGGLSQPAGVALDANQNVWVANSFYGNGSATLSEFTNSGTAISTSSGYPVSTRGYFNILAMDGAGTAWGAVCGPLCVGQGSTDSISHTAADGTLLNSPGFLNPTLASPQAIAIDPSGNLWVGNAGNGTAGSTGTVTELVGVAAPVKTPLQSALKSNLIAQRP